MTTHQLAATAFGLSYSAILNTANNTAGVKLAENIDTQPRNANATRNMTNQPKVDNFLTIEEKRAWLARIFRDTSGEYTPADKLKALEADNRLVMLQRPNNQTQTNHADHFLQ